jgi:hypothetical protein
MKFTGSYFQEWLVSRQGLRSNLGPGEGKDRQRWSVNTLFFPIHDFQKEHQIKYFSLAPG